jgi:hypothetical protein
MNGPLSQERREGELDKREQGRGGGGGDEDGPGAGERAPLRDAIVVIAVRFPARRKRPQPGRRRNHERGGEQKRRGR